MGPDTSGQAAREFAAAGWQTSRGHHTVTLSMRQARGMRCYYP